jgi:hypothetical protein
MGSRSMEIATYCVTPAMHALGPRVDVFFHIPHRILRCFHSRRLSRHVERLEIAREEYLAVQKHMYSPQEAVRAKRGSGTCLGHWEWRVVDPRARGRHRLPLRVDTVHVCQSRGVRCEIERRLKVIQADACASKYG